MNRKIVIASWIFVAIVAGCVAWEIIVKQRECDAAGKAMVRGLWGLECVSK